MSSPKFVKFRLNTAIYDKQDSVVWINPYHVTDIIYDEETSGVAISVVNENIYYVEEDLETVLIRLQG